MIMTYNEVSNLRDAIESFPKDTSIVVYDSFSQDGTAELARSLGARVVCRLFDDWSTHQNWAVANIDFGTEWVYYGDADERMTPSLWQEIEGVLAAPGDAKAFAMRRQDMFLGTWLKHSSFYPTWLVRLFRPEAIRWERLVNPVAIVGGRVGRLTGHFIHHQFSKGTIQWFERHIKYADLEAQEFIRETSEPIVWSSFASRDHSVRRRALKSAYYRLPMRPVLRFWTLYLLKGGFLDGRAGLYYSAMQASYELMIQMRVTELRRRALGRPV